ncbi:SRPBCC family protein [Marininema halotolerans]|uniref:Polyketide cyclase / dehydrase and lipid transport n=1 Tax=Marininema halotolerans TaxID=1155944 RepID=A0A1I6S055_9BACL|nr:SRPBCC family protein [Marininema halotolerans]SFS70314.1 Polyketide cyclase / dehydrase and lipid transport [Marininema halotolerans]
MPSSAEVDHIFQCPANTLWNLIGDFGDMKSWGSSNLTSCVQEGTGIGSIRTITIHDSGKDIVIVDRLDAETERSYTYSIVSSPLPYQSYQATMAVKELDGTQSQLTWSSTFEPKGITEIEAIEYTKQMYQRGMKLMEQALIRQGLLHQ